MICPKCGTAIPEGYMYCSKCGEEVIMVPDFEVELEAGIEETISEVAEMMADTVEVDTVKKAETATEVKNGLSKKIKFIIAAAAVLGLLLVFAIIKITSSVKSYYSFDEQFKELDAEFIRGEYDDAIKTAKHVISLKPDDKRSRLILADSYFNVYKYDESIAVLYELLDDYPDDREIYERLIACFEAEDDTEDIINLSKRANDKIFAELFEDYMCAEPEFSEEGGNYYGTQSIELTTSGKGTIYYTLDGSEPGEDSLEYSEPIIVEEEGETVIKAIHINEKGVSSKAVSKTYNIIKLAPAIPRLITQGGDYSIPKLIKVEEPQTGTLYYTTDGTDPTEASPEYEPPIAMPLGKSEFRFVIINDSGEAGEVVTAEYNLKISGLDETYAAGLVQLTLMTLGHDVSTHTFKAKYGYSQGSRSYYMIEEYDGSKKQGTDYAVDAQTGEVFTISANRETGDFDFGVVK
ncbi:MAG: chitobiase/beta-hexosaminidase C-terminal domain-containing protein [Lachnospiraceae bacterium]|nr:chitobiase/beta-hexosaminidase C-terminal domain-containing protein [Lachnospiraceae bacterium]